MSDAPPPAPSPSPTQQAFLGGDSLRALAVSAVFLFHASFGAALADGYDVAIVGDSRAALDGAYGPADAIVEVLPVAVYVFFALSGYLLSRRFVQAYVDGTRVPSMRNFLRNRVLRIVPAFWFVFGLGLLRYGTNGSSIEEILAIPLFLQVYVHGPATDVIAHGWTVDTEWALYLGIPLVVAVLLRLRPERLERRGRIAVVAGLLAAVYLTSMAFRTLGPDDIYYQRAFWAAGWSFLPGIALALVEVVYAERIRGAHWARPVALGAVAALLPVALLYASTEPGQLGRQALLATVAVTLVLGGPLLLQWGTGGCWRILDNRPLRWLGERSYGFYLLHFLVGVEIAQRLVGDSARIDLLWTIPLAYAITVVLAAANYRLVEAPFLVRKVRQAPAARPAG